MTRPDPAANPIRPCRGPLRRPIALPLALALVFMAVTAPISGCSFSDLVRGAQSPASAAAAKAEPRKPTVAEKFSDATDKLTGDLEAATAALKAGRDAEAKLAAITASAKSLEALDSGMRAWFADTRDVLAKVDSAEKDAIQAKVEKTYDARYDALTSRLAALASAEGTAAQLSALASAAGFLDKITPEEVHQPLGTELPHRIVDAKAGPPILGTSIAPAYAPHTPGAQPSPLSPVPTSDDLTQTVEVTFEQDITSLATSLGHDPVRIYEHVRNTIDFEPYYGSRKGALETLWEGAGNDIDTASLLIALMRRSDIPARYVSGVVEVPIDRAMNWVGVEKPEAAAKLFSAGGTPVKAIVSGGKIVRLRLEHTWAEVYVPYESYRGVATGPGEAKKQWVPLDASFKQYENPPPIRIDASRTIPPDSMSLPTSGSVATSDSLTGVDLGQMRRQMVSTAERLAASCTETPTLASLASVRAVRRMEHGLMPASLPLRAVAVAAEGSSISPAARTAFAVQCGSLSFSAPLAVVSNKRLTLSFVGASASDRDLFGSVSRLEDVPAHLAEVRPRLLIDGAVAAIGDAVPLGSTVEMGLTVRRPGADDSFSAAVVAGGYYALVQDTSMIDAHGFSERVSVLSAEASVTQQEIGAGVSEATSSIDALVGETLSLAGLSYFMQVDAADQLLSGPWGVVQQRQPSYATVGTGLRTFNVLGIATEAAPSGVFLDVKRDVHAVVSKVGDAASATGYALASGSMASYLEGLVLERAFGFESISAVRVLQIANNSGIPIVQISEGNREAIERLEVDAAARDDITAQVASGRTVTVPSRPLDYCGFQGTGYVVIDPDTGAGGYMISSGSAGGSTTGKATDEAFSADPFGATPAYAAEPGAPASPQSTEPQDDLAQAATLSAISIVLATVPALLSDNDWKPVANVLTAVATLLLLKTVVDTLSAMIEIQDDPEVQYGLFMAAYFVCLASQALGVYAGLKLEPTRAIAAGVVLVITDFMIAGAVISMQSVLNNPKFHRKAP